MPSDLVVRFEYLTFLLPQKRHLVKLSWVDMALSGGALSTRASIEYIRSLMLFCTKYMEKIKNWRNWVYRSFRTVLNPELKGIDFNRLEKY